jgi:hypothetical protein
MRVHEPRHDERVSTVDAAGPSWNGDTIARTDLGDLRSHDDHGLIPEVK